MMEDAAMEFSPERTSEKKLNVSRMVNTVPVRAKDLMSATVGPALVLLSRFLYPFNKEDFENVFYDEDHQILHLGRHASFRVELMAKHYLQGSQWEWAKDATFEGSLLEASRRASTAYNVSSILNTDQPCPWDSCADQMLAALACSMVNEDVVHIQVPMPEGGGECMLFILDAPQEIFEYRLLPDELVDAVSETTHFRSINQMIMICSILKWANVPYTRTDENTLIAHFSSGPNAVGREDILISFFPAQGSVHRVSEMRAIPVPTLRA